MLLLEMVSFTWVRNSRGKKVDTFHGMGTETILLDREPIVVEIVGFLGDKNMRNSCTVKGSPEQAVMKRAGELQFTRTFAVMFGYVMDQKDGHWKHLSILI